MGQIPNLVSRTVDGASLQYLRPKHKEIARRLVLGQTQVQISEALGMNQGRLSIIVNSPLFRMHLKELETQRDETMMDVRNTLKELSPIALEVLEKTMYETESEVMKVKCAESLLDRAGFGKVAKVEIESNVSISPVDLSAYRKITEGQPVQDLNMVEQGGIFEVQDD